MYSPPPGLAIVQITWLPLIPSQPCTLHRPTRIGLLPPVHFASYHAPCFSPAQYDSSGPSSFRLSPRPAAFTGSCVQLHTPPGTLHARSGS
ncbi:hypothetical protein PCASD_10434 [Puccinia coronata f. sp. avenae]|uniref:Uncharacterized protein n=1 Tax=Puccinia coronata f. sp. avenae TaxID=200324 RepID=A0A2N5UEN0_9BASI|nr:hypothetical protein PCASD_10434 [Puccinia coronata f. sp. avenae]